MAWTIYCHTHRDSGRRYVGLTKRTWQERWRGHLHDAQHLNTHFAAAIRKYGKDAFSHEVLEVCFALEEANEREQFWIWTYDTRNPLRGFNLAPGGKHIPHPARNPWDDPVYRAAAIIRSRTMWQDPTLKARHSKIMKAVVSDLGIKSNMSMRAKRQWREPESRQKLMVAAKDRGSKILFREKCRSNWKDPDFRERCSVSLRESNALRAAKTHCKHGHEYTLENTIRSRSGTRECRTCYKLRKQRRRQLAKSGA